MIKEIERPDWLDKWLPIGLSGLSVQHSEYKECCNRKAAEYGLAAVRHLDEWFDQTIEPLNKAIREGVEVYNGRDLDCWATGDQGIHTHKALLIGVEKIKKESAADVLNDLLKVNSANIKAIIELKDRAKAALANEGE